MGLVEGDRNSWQYGRVNGTKIKEVCGTLGMDDEQDSVRRHAAGSPFTGWTQAALLHIAPASWRIFLRNICPGVGFRLGGPDGSDIWFEIPGARSPLPYLSDGWGTSLIEIQKVTRYWLFFSHLEL